MNYYDDIGRQEEIDDLRRRVLRKKEIVAAKKLTRTTDFVLYLEEAGPLNFEQELGYRIDNRDWDE